jgi:MFS family permease
VEQRVKASWYRWYVLLVLILIYLMSQIDRQILTVLAPLVRADLHLTDAQLGLLYGTAFALFYGVFGVPLSKFADGGSRGRALWIALFFWSVMTAACGLSFSFAGLALARVGVGLGEASASPASVSLLGDYFEPERRATILGLYFVGGYLGLGASAMVGGAVAHAWSAHYPNISLAPWHLQAWQAAFVTVALPGLALAVLVALTIREPRRERLTQTVASIDLPYRAVVSEIATMLPPLSLFSIGRRLGLRGVITNAAGALLLILLAAGLIEITDGILSPERRPILFSVLSFTVTSNVVQWSVIALSVYAIGSWLQVVRHKDPVSFQLTVGNSTFAVLLLANGAMAVCTQSLYGFVFLYAHRYFGLDTGLSFQLGATLALTSALGVIAGGAFGDLARRRRAAGRVHVAMLNFILVLLVSLIEFATSNVHVFYLMFGLDCFLLTPWVGCLIATGQDLVLPRMRGLAYSVSGLMSAVVGLGLGPYFVGLISDASGSLRIGVLSALLSVPLAFLCSAYVASKLQGAEATVATRALLAGEKL